MSLIIIIANMPSYQPDTPLIGQQRSHIQAISSPSLNRITPGGAPSPASCAPPAPDACRPMAAMAAQPPPPASLACDRRCALAHRHGEVVLIFNVSTLLLSNGLAHRTSPTRPSRGSLQVESARLPRLPARCLPRSLSHVGPLPPVSCLTARLCPVRQAESSVAATVATVVATAPRHRVRRRPVRRHRRHRDRRRPVHRRPVLRLRGPRPLVLVLLAVVLSFIRMS